MKITRKILSVVLVALLAVSMTACSRESEIVITRTSMEVADGRFSGTETHTVSLTAGAAVTFDIETRGGSIAISVSDEAGNEILRGTGVQGSAISVAIGADGEYTIKIEADSHRGSFRVSWE